MNSDKCQLSVVGAAVAAGLVFNCGASEERRGREEGGKCAAVCRHAATPTATVLKLILGALLLVGIAGPRSWAADHVVRVGFEEDEELTYLTTEYLPYGIEFQDIGLDGTPSWGVAALHPFGELNWPLGYVPYGMKIAGPSPWGNGAKLARNIRVASYLRLRTPGTLLRMALRVMACNLARVSMTWRLASMVFLAILY